MMAPDEAVSERNEASEQSGNEGEYRHQPNEEPIHGRQVDRHCVLLAR